VTSVAWHPVDNTKLASASWDGTIKILDVETGDCLRTLEGHTGVNSVAWNVGGTLLASASLDTTVTIWGSEAVM